MSTEKGKTVILFLSLYSDKRKTKMKTNGFICYSFRFYFLNLNQKIVQQLMDNGLGTVGFLRTNFLRNDDGSVKHVENNIGRLAKLSQIHFVIRDCMKGLAEVADGGHRVL